MLMLLTKSALVHIKPEKKLHEASPRRGTRPDRTGGLRETPTYKDPDACVLTREGDKQLDGKRLRKCTRLMCGGWVYMLSDVPSSKAVTPFGRSQDGRGSSVINGGRVRMGTPLSGAGKKKKISWVKIEKGRGSRFNGGQAAAEWFQLRCSNWTPFPLVRPTIVLRASVVWLNLSP